MVPWNTAIFGLATPSSLALSASHWAALAPVATLSLETTAKLRLPPEISLLKPTQGMPASVALATAGARASESAAWIRMTSQPMEIKSSIWEAWTLALDSQLTSETSAPLASSSFCVYSAAPTI